ncbi:MAG TPA: HU family DNA-binding protein [Thermoanaerobaculia bacterium]|nr:HU family DNA-binding protein [Thermoanaerobaculia bacterium]HUM28774.1 HU family DNA-binding protein [Thermoanaerobaculia bacterium]HXK67976.1 HU family DNA-binding protein [Thermoanaerobaculia bacterium]
MAGKLEFVELVADKVKLTKKEAAAAIDAFLEGVRASLAKGDRVSLPKVGTFHVVSRASRMGRNPATGAKIKIPASKTVRFKVSQTLKSDVNKKKGKK